MNIKERYRRFLDGLPYRRMFWALFLSNLIGLFVFMCIAISLLSAYAQSGSAQVTTHPPAQIAATEVAIEEQGDTPVPTETPSPTDTPAPTETPAPTSTKRPTRTPKPVTDDVCAIGFEFMGEVSDMAAVFTGRDADVACSVAMVEFTTDPGLRNSDITVFEISDSDYEEYYEGGYVQCEDDYGGEGVEVKLRIISDRPDGNMFTEAACNGILGE